MTFAYIIFLLMMWKRYNTIEFVVGYCDQLYQNVASGYSNRVIC